MNRLGFITDEIDDLIHFITSNPTLKIVSIFSHLAGSSSETFDDFTKQQIHTFEQISQKISNAFSYPIIRHINNSQGIQRHPEAQFDMVRLGIGMYGISDTDKNKLKEVNTLYSCISQIKTIKPNESIGYDRKGVMSNGGKIAIVPIGYADGIRRSLSNNKGSFMIKGQLAPIIGNVCMDMCMLDVSKIDCKEGDRVLIFGEEYPIKNIAQQMDTIEYEVLTGISQRVKRIYFQE
jgi:alanine racemase